MKRYLVYMISLVHVTAVFGQSTANGYQTDSVGHFSISQIQLDNWETGGESSLNWQINIQSGMKNERKTISESHEISLSFGNSKTGSLPSRKSLDEINLESVIRLKTKNRFLPYVSIKMQTQFAPGYQYEGTVSKKVSGSMDPVYVTESTGLTRQLFNRLNMRLGLAMKQTFTTHFHVLYTDDPDTPDIEKSKFEYGLEWVGDYRKNVNEFSTVTMKIELFSNLAAVRRTDVRWDGNYTTQISDFIDIGFNFQLIYDEDISHKRQIRQFLTIGISYTFR